MKRLIFALRLYITETILHSTNNSFIGLYFLMLFLVFVRNRHKNIFKMTPHSIYIDVLFHLNCIYVVAKYCQYYITNYLNIHFLILDRP